VNPPTDRFLLEAKLGSIPSSYDTRSDTSAVQFALASPRHDWQWEWVPSTSPQQYFIASTTKLFVTAIVMQLCDERRLELDTPAAKCP
jgi:hypothetical protein